MLRTLRQNTKWIFYILALAFVGWMVFDVGMGVTGQGSYGAADVVLKVNGQAVHTTEYQAALQNAYEQFRQQNGFGPLTREDERQIQDQVVDQLIQSLLLREEYQRLGITATEEEIMAAARTSPPPEVMQAAEFQTNGQFDVTKYQRYLATGDRQFLQALEARYREQIPQVKLAQYLTADVYVSDAKLWRIYRDQHDSVTVALVALQPALVPDSEAAVSEAAVERYFAAHRDDYKRPAVAYLTYTALDRRPDAADTAAARARALVLRAEVLRGGADRFAVVAKRESADSASGREGGDLRWLKRNQPGYDPQFLAGLRALRPGQVSEPVLSSFGYHLIRADAARGDSVRARHILVPVELHGAHLDAVEARADTLDRLAAEQTDRGALDSAAPRLELPLALARVVEGERLTLGRYVVPDVSIWAFEAAEGETSPVIEGRVAYYVFRLDSLIPEGVPPLAAVHEAVLADARLERKRAVAREKAEAFADRLHGAASLAQAAARHGLRVERLGPFTRLSPPIGEPLVVGAAFGLRVGERSGSIDGEAGFYFVESLARRGADSTAWLAQRDAQRAAILEPARQARLQGYLEGLRAQAKIVDRRKELYRSAAAAGGGG